MLISRGDDVVVARLPWFGRDSDDVRDAWARTPVSANFVADRAFLWQKLADEASNSLCS